MRKNGTVCSILNRRRVVARVEERALINGQLQAGWLCVACPTEGTGVEPIRGDQ
jgi:hypothetical protein